MFAPSSNIHLTTVCIVWIVAVSSFSSVFASTTVVSDARMFDYCRHPERLNEYEFQDRLSMDKFKTHGDSLPLRVEALFRDFIAAAKGAIVGDAKRKESVFLERSWFLTQPNGRPLPQDASKEVPYTTSCYVRSRVKRELKGAELGRRKFSSALKIRGVDVATFQSPKDVKGDLDCDVYSNVHRATYKTKIKKLDGLMLYKTFGDVLDKFPYAEAYFELPRDQILEVRDAYAVRRWEWKKLRASGVKLECSLDLRFGDEEKAVAGVDPFLGEFSCSLEVEKIKDKDESIDGTLEMMKSVFEAFRATGKWT